MNLNASHFFDLTEFEHQELFTDCLHVWEALHNLKDYLAKTTLGKIEVNIPDNVYLVNRHLISIGKGTVVEPGAYISGPCIIGQNCSIRHGAYIRGDVIAGNGAVIGHTTEVKHSILLNKAHAAHFNYVGDSILGNHVNLGAGVKCANLRLDNQEVVINSNGQRFQTSLRKLGAIIGDHSQLGCNTVCNPGTLIEKNTLCGPNLTLSGVVSSSAKARRS